MTRFSGLTGDRRGGHLRVTLAVVVATTGITDAVGTRAGDWAGAEVAWRNDPRPAADAPLPVEPPATRRTGRRGQRRAMRRGEFQPSAPIASPATPQFAPLPDQPAGVAEPGADAVTLHRDHTYGDHPRQRFDMILPDGCSSGRLPLVAWIHGPDWRTGTKATCPVDWLAGQGYAVASIEYRTSDMVAFPGQLADCRAALAEICGAAETWGIDAGRICVAGDGGGGHLATLVAYADEAATRLAAADAEAGDHFRPAAVAAFDAPTHLPSLGGQHDRAGSAASRLVGGPLPEFREAAQRASPLTHVSADAPPTLIVQSTGGDVPADQGRLLDAALDAAGVDADLVVLDGPASTLVPLHDSPAGTALLEFLDRTLGPGPIAHEP